MSRSQVERRLLEVTARLKKAREELVVLDEQLVALADEADDLRVRALVDETPLAEKEHREAQKHADALARSRAAVAAAVADLESTQDRLLDQLVPGSR